MMPSTLASLGARIGVPGLALASTPMSVRPSVKCCSGLMSPPPLPLGAILATAAEAAAPGVSLVLAGVDVVNWPELTRLMASPSGLETRTVPFSGGAEAESLSNDCVRAPCQSVDDVGPLLVTLGIARPACRGCAMAAAMLRPLGIAYCLP